VAEGSLFPKLNAAFVSALAALDEELCTQSEERYVHTRNFTCLIIQLDVNGKNLRGLVDTGSEINLITESARA
jgi:predicted aspartyl protease